MAFLPGIFGGGNKQPQQQQTPAQNPQSQNNLQQPNQQPNQQQTPVNSNGSGGGVQDQQNRAANSQMDTNNPLDPFMALMTPSKEVLDARHSREQTRSKGLFGDNFTPENIQKTVGGVNFTQNLDPAKVTAALGGDSNAFMEVINAAVQSGVSASVQMSHGMVEKGVQTGQERFSGDLDSRFRDFTLRGQNVDNPALKHPVGKALLSTVAKQIADANPRMSADEVHKQATSMFSEFTKLMNQPTEEANQQASQKGQMDWMNFVDEPNQ
jgi:hypothetical protein